MQKKLPSYVSQRQGSRYTLTPHYDLSALAQLDERVETHIDGLIIAGDSGWEMIEKELVWDEPGGIFQPGFWPLNP